MDIGVQGLFQHYSRPAWQPGAGASI